MNECEFADSLTKVGHGDRSFSVLRKVENNRPLASSEQIADQLEEDIAREIFSPGEPLREAALSERFNVSRGPIRDALRLLEADGLVKLQPNRGAIVSDYSASDLAHIALISKPLTTLILSNVVANSQKPTLKLLWEAQQRIGLLLENRDSVAFALAIAMLTMRQASFAAGDFGERVLQMLYRPSIRYTIAGLGYEGAPERAHRTWQAHCLALAEGRTDDASAHFLKMLRDIHLPVIR